MARVPSVTRLRPRLGGYFVPIVAVVAALLIGAIILLRLGADPIEGFGAMFSGAFGSSDALIGTALKATPLLLVGVGITIAFRANVINIGGDKKFIKGVLLLIGWETAPWLYKHFIFFTKMMRDK